ncbi:zinc finger protein ZAT1-like [Wolffia australiana]
MEKHACKLCSRRFGNGRALGGHMRSHVAGGKRAIQRSSPSSKNSTVVVAEDGESEAESSMGPPLRRSRRRGAAAARTADGEPGPASSVSDAASEEDVARCLMMLSRDVWTDSETARSRKAHQCSICQRVFPSGQALGGHKRSHLTANSKPPNDRDFDLNQPAEEQGENSAVSYSPR